MKPHDRRFNYYQQDTPKSPLIPREPKNYIYSRCDDINMSHIIRKYSLLYIEETKNPSDIILVGNLYWTFRNNIFKNILIPNKIKVDFNKWNMTIITNLFSKIIFDNDPTMITRYMKEGWIGWKLNDDDKQGKNKFELNKIFNNFLNMYVLKSNNVDAKVSKDAIWKQFKEWWRQQTTKGYYPNKQIFFTYMTNYYFKSEPIIEDTFIGWKNYMLYK